MKVECTGGKKSNVDGGGGKHPCKATSIHPLQLDHREQQYFRAYTEGVWEQNERQQTAKNRFWCMSAQEKEKTEGLKSTVRRGSSIGDAPRNPPATSQV